MKRFFIALLLVAVTLTNTGCVERIDAGSVGIKVNMYGDAKGVDSVTEVTGRVFYNPLTTSIYEWPTYVQTAAWTADEREGSPSNEAIDFQTNDGMGITADVGVSYSYAPDQVPAMFTKFRKTPDIIQATYLRTQVRDIFTKAAAGYSIERFIVEKDKFIQAVNVEAKRKLGPEGFVIDTISFIGSPVYPESVVLSIQNKINASQVAQQKQRELEQEQAEAAKKVAIAQGEADARKIEAEGVRALTSSLTPLYVEFVKIQKWDNKLPQVVTGSSSMINVSLK